MKRIGITLVTDEDGILVPVEIEVDEPDLIVPSPPPVGTLVRPLPATPTRPHRVIAEA